MTFTVTYRGADGALREEAVDAAGRAECFAQMKARGIVPPGAEIALNHNFNTELIFFMDHPYHNGLRKNDVWCLASPKATKQLNEKQPGVWKEHLRTPEDHQYPAVLLERVSGAGGQAK